MIFKYSPWFRGNFLKAILYLLPIAIGPFVDMLWLSLFFGILLFPMAVYAFYQQYYFEVQSGTFRVKRFFFPGWKHDFHKEDISYLGIKGHYVKIIKKEAKTQVNFQHAMKADQVLRMLEYLKTKGYPAQLEEDEFFSPTKNQN